MRNKQSITSPHLTTSNLEYLRESTGLSSTKTALSILDLGLPLCSSQYLKSTILSRRPSASPTTLPSSWFSTKPKMDSSTAFCCVNFRKKTPCTFPVIVNLVLISIDGLGGDLITKDLVGEAVVETTRDLLVSFLPTLLSRTAVAPLGPGLRVITLPPLPPATCPPGRLMVSTANPAAVPPRNASITRSLESSRRWKSCTLGSEPSSRLYLFL